MGVTNCTKSITRLCLCVVSLTLVRILYKIDEGKPITKLLLSGQTESVRDHKFHSGYVIHRWLSQIGGTLFRTCIKLKSKQRESGASQSLHVLQMRSEMRLCLFIQKETFKF